MSEPDEPGDAARPEPVVETGQADGAGSERADPGTLQDGDPAGPDPQDDPLKRPGAGDRKPGDGKRPDEPEKRFEDADPEPGQGDDDAARGDRRRGFAPMTTLSTGSHGRSYQAGQMTFYGGEPSAVPVHGPVPGDVLRKLTGSYVEPVCAGRLQEALLTSPVQCLVGPPFHGRTTTAIAVGTRYLRDRHLKADGNVHILSSDRGLNAVTANAIPEGKALVLTLPPDAPPPDVSWFVGIAEAVRERRSVLVVVSAHDPVGPAAVKIGWTIAYAPPAPAEVFRRHLGQRYTEERIATITALREVREQVRRCETPRDAALLAVEIINDLDNGLADGELLSGEPSDHLATARKELQQSELWDRILLVAATVMGDLAAGTVTREALRLAEMHKPTGVQGEGPRVEWFTGPDRWTGTIKLGDPAGDGSGRTVRLAHPRLGIPLLKAVWEDHVGERDLLLPWLYGLGMHPHKRVRVKAAQAAAQLACYDFDVVMREVLQVWALDGRFRSRETCAMAVEALFVAADGKFAKRVRGQVQSWARSNNVALLAAAVAAYGTVLGAKDPDEALARMREIAGARVFRFDGHQGAAEQAEQGLANIVQRALVDVFTAGAQEKVIQALAAWSGVPNWRWRRAAARGLLELARKDGSGPWPLLVELSVVQEATYAAVLALWRNTLDARHRDEAAWEGLRRWLNQTRDLRGKDSAGSLVAIVDRLESDLRTDQDIARHLDFHQKIWAFREGRRKSARPTKEMIR